MLNRPCSLASSTLGKKDGDELDGIEDWFVFPKADYLLIEGNDGSANFKGVHNDHDSGYDKWPRLVGWYVADINGKKRQYSRLTGESLRGNVAFVP